MIRRIKEPVPDKYPQIGEKFVNQKKSDGIGPID